MARDDEFRKVAEDLRALARSLARDFREAVDQARVTGQPTGSAFRHGIRGVADEARRGVRSNWSGHHRRRGYYSGYGGWGPPWTWPPPGAGRTADPSAPPGPGGPAGPDGPDPSNPAARGYGYPRQAYGPGRARPPYWAGPQWPRPPKARNKSSPLPPVRRRWDVTTVLGMLAVLFGLAWLLGALHAIHVPVEAVVAIGLMLLGAAVIVTARTDWSLSRHSWPVWLGAGLIVILIATSSALGIGGAFDHVSFGTMNRTVTAASGQTVYGGFGKVTVDAAGVPPGGNFTVKSAAGQTSITTAWNVPIVLHAKVLGGQICVDGRDQAHGANQTVNGQFGPPNGLPPVVVNVHQMAGQVLVNGSGCGR